MAWRGIAEVAETVDERGYPCREGLRVIIVPGAEHRVKKKAKAIKEEEEEEEEESLRYIQES